MYIYIVVTLKEHIHVYTLTPMHMYLWQFNFSYCRHFLSIPSFSKSSWKRIEVCKYETVVDTVSPISLPGGVEGVVSVLEDGGV